MTYSAVPEDLRQVPRWIVWKYVGKGEGKRTKVPCNSVSGLPADVNDAANHLAFEDAVERSMALVFEGIGFVFVEGGGFCGVDLDHCIDSEGEIAPWAVRYLIELQSYAEVSPSERGIKVFLRGSLPPDAKLHRKAGLGADGTGEVEFYDARRFFTVTGRHVGWTPRIVDECNDVLAGFYRECFPPAVPEPGVPPSSPNGKPMKDLAILEMARSARNAARFRKLFDDGDLSDHMDDPSRADLALCSHLAFWCKGNPETIDRLFRMSKLSRDKWLERDDYRKLTIDRALAGMKGYYSEDRPATAEPAPTPVLDEDLIVRAEDIEPEAVDWLWEGRVPRRFLTVFYGRTAIGKSFVALDIACRITRSGEWPFSGGLCAEPGNVLIISEDPQKHMLVPRIMALGGDRTKIRFMSWKAMIQWKIHDTVLLERACKAAGDPVLIVVDPPTNFLGNKDEHKNAEVRGALMHLVTWLDEYPTSMACILCTHTRKPTGNTVDSIFRMIGSIAWGTTARIAHALEVDPDDKNRNIFACSKTNIGEKPKALAYRLKQNLLELEGKRPIKIATVEWLAEVELDADDLGGSRGFGKSKTKLAKDWLIEMFDERLEWTGDMFWSRAKEAGLNRDDINRAKAGMMIPRAKRTVGADGNIVYTHYVPDTWKFLTKHFAQQHNSTTDSEVVWREHLPVVRSVVRPDEVAQLEGDDGQSPVVRVSPSSTTDRTTGSPIAPTTSESVVLLCGCATMCSEDSKKDVNEDWISYSCEFLMDGIGFGPMTLSEVETVASQRGIPMDAVNDAMERIGVVKTWSEGQIILSLKEKPE